MARFSDIIGQEQMKEHLQTALSTGKISHAYIFDGEKDAGKEFIANIFAMALQCENQEDAPCQECHSCKQTLSKNQPDIIYVTHEKPNTIGVDDIRLQVNQDVDIKPYARPWKIYIIRDAEKMSTQAQNALLKTLEEPPSYAVIILLTSQIELLLPTILSRCITLHFKSVEDSKIKKFLMEEIQVPDYQAEVCVAFARGNVGKAKSLARSEEFDTIKNEAITLMKYLDQMEINEIVGAIKQINEHKLSINDYLDIISIWYRDILLFKATNDLNHLIFREEIQYIKKVANKSGYEGIEIIINAIEKAKVRLRANVNFDLTMELLFLTIREN
ncbi:MAG: DNA polymerase III subunit delta' [Eubacteriales bacterium]